VTLPAEGSTRTRIIDWVAAETGGAPGGRELAVVVRPEEEDGEGRLGPGAERRGGAGEGGRTARYRARRGHLDGVAGGTHGGGDRGPEEADRTAHAGEDEAEENEQDAAQPRDAGVPARGTTPARATETLRGLGGAAQAHGGGTSVSRHRQCRWGALVQRRGPPERPPDWDRPAPRRADLNRGDDTGKAVETADANSRSREGGRGRAFRVRSS